MQHATETTYCVPAVVKASGHPLLLLMAILVSGMLGEALPRGCCGGDAVSDTVLSMRSQDAKAETQGTLQ
jgi:hypothetical protein